MLAADLVSRTVLSAAKGEAILAHAVNGLAELLHDIDAFDLGDLARL